jgi:selenide,water dikinase
MKTETSEIRLTQFSHGAGCGCKIAPTVLDIILHNNEAALDFPGLLVGNSSRDDAAVYDIGNGIAMISTTDFFMPIVDDPFEFGRIAATNAISDVYAMGGTPNMAIAILGWPVDKIAPEVAGRVVAGGRKACNDAGIPLAGGHSIDCPEPVFGLAVNGLIPIKNIRKNDSAKSGDLLFLTKPLGVGIIATASKRSIATEEDLAVALKQMTTLNKIGSVLGQHSFIHALTDVTGFGLLGHLIEMAEGSGLTAHINYDAVPAINGLEKYIAQGSIPGGTKRNWASYGHKVLMKEESHISLLADPQTSGGLLIAVDRSSVDDFKKIMKDNGMEEFAKAPIGELQEKQMKTVIIN